MRPILAGILGIFFTVLVILPQTGTAKGPDTLVAELKCAIFHAGELAQKGAALAMSQLHVQHVVNFLEGPTGKDFKAAVGYPCQDQGAGILPELKTASAAGVRGADAALRFATVAQTLALDALTMKDVNEVQPWAKVISVYLQRAFDALQ